MGRAGTADWHALPEDTSTSGIEAITASASAPVKRRFAVLQSRGTPAEISSTPGSIAHKSDISRSVSCWQ